MTILQKYSVFTLVVMAAIAATAFGIVVVTGTPHQALAAFSLLAVLVLGRRWFRDGETPAMDERDQEIWRKAMLFAYTIFWIVFVGSGVAIPLILGETATIPAGFLILAPLTGAWLLYVVRASAILVLYARGA